MKGRLKLQVWSTEFKRWKTAHVLITMERRSNREN
jgi:hypothetical protein